MVFCLRFGGQNSTVWCGLLAGSSYKFANTTRTFCQCQIHAFLNAACSSFLKVRKSLGSFMWKNSWRKLKNMNSCLATEKNQMVFQAWWHHEKSRGSWGCDRQQMALVYLWNTIAAAAFFGLTELDTKIQTPKMVKTFGRHAEPKVYQQLCWCCCHAWLASGCMKNLVFVRNYGSILWSFSSEKASFFGHNCCFFSINMVCTVSEV